MMRFKVQGGHRPATIAGAPPAPALRVRWSACVLCLAAFWLAPSASAAEAPPTFWTRCLPGAGAGQCSLPRGIGVDATEGPHRGHLYVADQSNYRILEFSAWGEFIKAWGWDVAPEGAPGDTAGDRLETCTVSCQKGAKGPGAGQLNFPQGVAVDSSGDVYVVDLDAHRVQKFTPEGEFILMFGGEVNKTKSETPGSSEAERNLCTAASGDVCQAGTKGVGHGQFGELAVGSYIADGAGPPERIYVGDQNRIQEFDTEGHYAGDFPDPEGLLVGKTVLGLASRSGGGLYLVRQGTANVISLTSSGTKACTATVGNPRSVVEGAGGSFYVVDNPPGFNDEPIEPRVLEFGGSCGRTSVPDFGQDVLTGDTPEGLGWGSACFTGGSGLYVGNPEEAKSFVRAYGPAPDPAICPPPRVAPEIAAQYATSVTATEAVLGASIDSHYFTADAGTTRYHLQYATAGCIEAGGWEAECVQTAPEAEGAKLSGGPSGDPLPTAGVFLSGLAPATAYRYRFVVEAKDREGLPVVEGQPVIGQGGKPFGVEGAAASFRTFPLPEAPRPCANDALRAGPAAALPDCRAYEMVSPLDKEGGDVLARFSVSSPGLARLDQSAEAVPASGAGLTYSTYRSFGGAPSAPFSSQYLASRHSLDSSTPGWSSEPISPPQEGEFFNLDTLPFLWNLNKYFSPDLSEGWLETLTEPVLGEGGVAGYANLYRHDLLSGSYQACTTSPPPDPPGHFEPDLEGVTPDASLALFGARDALTPDATQVVIPNFGKPTQIYACERQPAGPRALHLVSVLPDGTASQKFINSVGTASEAGHAFDIDKRSTLAGALSEDGSRVYWTAVSDESGGAGDFYVRLNPTAPESDAKDGGGNCLPEAERACTLAVASFSARFFGAAADGSRAIIRAEPAGGGRGGFGEKPSDLYEFDLAAAEAGEEALHLIAPRATSVLALGNDATWVYFASLEDLDGAGPAAADRPNLYLYEAGPEPTNTYIGPLSDVDSGLKSQFAQPSASQYGPAFHLTRASADGQTLLFAANSPELAASLGYDNADVVSGKADLEVYRYEATADQLACISCNPSGARPAGRLAKDGGAVATWEAARIPGWQTSFYPGRALSADGRRAFFESFDPLVLNDTNGKEDVYEWEAPGAGSCEEADAAFVPASGGCLYLLSSGTAASDSEFVDASADGSDAFIRSAQSLLPADPGLYDIYDARSGGGFPPPAAAAGICEGEACQPPPAAPDDQSPASETFQGAGNVVPARAKACAKNKTRRKGRCVKRHRKRHAARAASHNRRAPR